MQVFVNECAYAIMCQCIYIYVCELCMYVRMYVDVCLY